LLQAVCDLPTAAFIPELFEAYPDSKAIIVQRPVDKWYDSCKKTVQTVETSSVPFVLQYLDPYFLGRFIPTMDFLITGLFGPLGQPPKQKQESTSFRAKMFVIEKRALLRMIRSFGTGMLAVAGVALAYYTIYDQESVTSEQYTQICIYFKMIYSKDFI